MNTRTLIATALVTASAALAGTAFAQEGTQDFAAPAWNKPTSSLTRAEVMAAAKDAVSNDAASYVGEVSAAPQAASMLTRAQVVAETREAQRLGLLDNSVDDMKVATPAQLEQIRVAGLRAVQGGSSVANAAR